MKIVRSVSVLGIFLYACIAISVCAQEPAAPPVAPEPAVAPVVAPVAVPEPAVAAPPVAPPVAVPVSVQLKERCTLAILPFQIGNFLETSFEAEDGGLKITRTLVETEFTNQLTTFLTKSRKFHVLDRQTIRKVMDENYLTESEWSAPGQMQKIGQLLVADYLVLGAIDRCSFERKVTDIKITGEKSVNWICTFKFSFRVTEVKTGKVVYADTIVEKVKSRDIKREIDPDTWRDWTLNDYKDLLFERAAVRSGNAILIGIYPVKISAVTGTQVILNRGDGAGVVVGQKYRIFNQGAVVRDPDSGEILGSDETEAGILLVSSVESKFSKATVVSSTGQIAVGAICRPVQEVEEEAAPAYPAAEVPKW
jgi:curli biogenesis system outer membrane secretion channel CsgG